MTDRRALVVLALAHFAMVAMIQPRGDYPLNDDWAYAHSVQWLLEEHRIRLSQWVAMNLVPQTLAGAAVTSAFGFSFETLRHLTQAVAIAAMALTYAWFRTARLPASAALVATFAVVSFPAWGQLANSFMTDLYGLALGMGAAICFLRALEASARGWLVAGTAIAIAGVLQRQVVLVIPFAYMVTVVLTQPRTARTFAAAILPFVACFAAELLYHAYLAGGPGVPEGMRVAHGRLAPFVLKALTNDDDILVWQFSNLAVITGLTAIFSTGWILWWGMTGASAIERRALVLGGIAVAALGFALAWYPPYRGWNVMDRPGIGPFMLYDALRLSAPIDRTPGLFWPVLGVGASFAITALVMGAGRAASGLIRRYRDPVLVFTFVACVAYLAPFIATDYIDRYLLFPLPFLFVAWSRLWPAPSPSWRRSLGTVWIAAAIALATIGTRDYFSWNRARWDAIRLAERLGANADILDGGFEYNGYRRFERSGGGAPKGKSWWWVKDDVYVVAFSVVPGYDVVEKWPVRGWLPRTPREVLLLKRKP
jgi:hypothetical protein